MPDNLRLATKKIDIIKGDDESESLIVRMSW